MNTRSFCYLLLSTVCFFFYWGLLPKFNDIKGSFFAAGLIFLGFCFTEIVSKIRRNKLRDDLNKKIEALEN